MMYFEEMEQWLAQDRLDEAKRQAERVAGLLQRSATIETNDGDVNNIAINTAVNTGGEMVQVVEDEDEVNFYLKKFFFW